jgi:hypothetical protein
MGLIMAEAGILAALAMLYSLGYEHQNKTESQVYSSKAGRRILRHKYLAALIAGAAGFALIAGLTFALYFSVWDYSGLWNANVSSGNNTIFDPLLGELPFITWQSFTVGGYLAAVTALAFALTLVFALFGGVFGLLLIRSTYAAFIAAGMTLFASFAAGIVLLDAGFIGGYYAAMLTPVNLWSLRRGWLTDMGSSALFAYHETWGIALCFAVSAIVTVVALRRFKRKDMV